MKIRLWITLLLLLVGAAVYCRNDLQSAHPVWFNWLFPVVALTTFFIIARQCPNNWQGRFSILVGWIIGAVVALPLLLNVHDVAFRRDVERVQLGVTQAALFQQMEPYSPYESFSDNGMVIQKFRKPVRHDGYYWRGVFTLRNGSVVEKSVTHHQITPSDHDWVYPK